MPYAPSVYVVVFIYACRLGNGCSAEEIAKKLNLNINDVNAALMYWQDRSVLYVEASKMYFDEAVPEKFSLCKEKEKSKKVLCENPPSYQPEELAMYADKNEEVKSLFVMAQNKLCRMLTHSDMSAVFMIYHWMGLPMDVIELLLDFCVERGHRNTRYIEKVALDWCENGIYSAEEAQKRIYSYNTVYRKILKAMGQSMREPVAREIKYMKKWHEEYEMPLGLIELACSKTVMNLGKASFGYADKIIEAWKKSGFKTVEEVEISEKAFVENKKQQEKEENATVQRKNNRFINYDQRTYDYAQLEKLERERLRAEVKNNAGQN